MNFSTIIHTFLDRYPDGFEDIAYLRQERDPKLNLKHLLNQSAPLKDVAEGFHHSRDLIAVFKRSSGLLLDWRESSAVQTLLEDSDRAEQFTQYLARLAGGSLDVLPELDTLLRPIRVTKWPVATCLPFLWDTDESHMFLRYTPTTEFARRIGYDHFHYESALNEHTYSSLVDLCRAIQDDGLVAEQLRPRDYIDLQSLIWTTSRTHGDPTLAHKRLPTARAKPTQPETVPSPPVPLLAPKQEPRLSLDDPSESDPTNAHPEQQSLQPGETPHMPNDTERRLELLEKDLENERRSRAYERESRDRLHESIQGYFEASQKVSDSHLQTVDALTTSIRERLTSIESRLNNLPALVIGTVTLAVTIAIAILGYMVSQQEVRLVPLQPVQVAMPPSQPEVQTEPQGPGSPETPSDSPPLEESG